MAARIRVGGKIVSVAAGDESVWLTTDERKLLRIDPTTNAVVATIPLPESEWPENVAYGNGSAWVAVASPDTVNQPQLDSLLRIDPATNSIAARIPVGHSPIGLAFTSGSVWAADHRSETTDSQPTGTFSVSRVDTASNREIARVKVESRQTNDPHGQFCCGPSGITAAAGALWITDPTATPDGGFVIRLDPATNTVAATIPFTDTEACGGVAGDDTAIWVTTSCDQPQLVRIDPHTNRIVAEIDTGGATDSVALAFGSVWVTAIGVIRIDPATNTVVARTPIVNPLGLAVGSGSVWIGSGGTLIRMTPA